MERRASLAGIAVVSLLAGCAGHADDPAPAPPSETSKANVAPGAGDEPPAPTAPVSTAANINVDANLQALRHLEVFEVLGVIVNIPENANCYNLPCPGPEAAFVSAEDAQARAAQALADFTNKAIAAASDERDDGACHETDEANLQSLKELRIVQFGDAILEKPQASNCYYKRAIKLARIAQAFKRP